MRDKETINNQNGNELKLRIKDLEQEIEKLKCSHEEYPEPHEFEKFYQGFQPDL